MAYDVIVIGGGNAAMCSALSAREHGARVLVLEKAPETWRGGNGFFTAGGFRFAFKSFEELTELVPDLSDQERASMEVDPYTQEQFYDDLMRVTEECSDPDMAMQLVRESLPTVRWMRDRGVRWIPMFGRQAYKVGGRFRFWGGLVLEAVGGGAGLIDMEYQSAAKHGIDGRCESKATRLVTDARRTAFQIFDQKVLHLLREEYRIREVTKAEDLTIEGLARKLEIDVDGLVSTVRAYNASLQPGDYNPAIKDGKATRGITPPKSNWAQPLDSPPYVGYAVTTGITFTFGGLKITSEGQVIDCEQRPIPGLFAAGELVGGLFYHNYPGGAGLMAGAVFGRVAGRSAAAASRKGAARQP